MNKIDIVDDQSGGNLDERGSQMPYEIDIVDDQSGQILGHQFTPREVEAWVENHLDSYLIVSETEYALYVQEK